MKKILPFLFLLPFSSYANINDWDDYLRDKKCFFVDVNNPISTIKCKKSGLDNYDYNFPITPMKSDKFWDVDIQENSISNLKFLKNIKKIVNDFNGNNNELISINELSNLEYVGRTINLSGNPLIDIKGLENLKKTGSLYISETGIENVDSLFNVNFVDSNLYLNKNRLRNIDGLSNLYYVGGNINLSYNYFENVNGLIGLRAASIIDLRKNYNLDDLFGLSNLRYVDYIIVDNRIFRKMPTSESAFCKEKLYQKMSLTGNGYLKDSYPIIKIAMAFCSK